MTNGRYRLVNVHCEIPHARRGDVFAITLENEGDREVRFVDFENAQEVLSVPYGTWIEHADERYKLVPASSKMGDDVLLTRSGIRFHLGDRIGATFKVVEKRSWFDALRYAFS